MTNGAAKLMGESKRPAASVALLLNRDVLERYPSYDDEVQLPEVRVSAG